MTVDKEQFKMGVVSKKESEWLIPFEDVGLTLTTLEASETSNVERQQVIGDKQAEIVDWCKEIPGCNWSVGYIDDVTQSVFVIKWWFKDEDYPVVEPTE